MKLTDQEIIDALKAGKRIHIPSANLGSIILIDGFLHMSHKNYKGYHEKAIIHISELESNGWEIVEND